MAETTENECGLEARYYVTKINDPTGKHAECRYFVLDPQHDPLARGALGFYAFMARLRGFRALADDLSKWLKELREGENGEG